MKEPMTKSEFKAVMDVLIPIEAKFLRRGTQFRPAWNIVRDEMKTLYAEVGPTAVQIYFDERYQKVLLNKSV